MLGEVAGTSILLIDDDPDLRELLAQMLQKYGLTVRTAHHGLEALRQLVNETPSVILVDLKMPVMDGWETARRIRAMDGDLKHVPIVAITAQAMAGDEEIALASGCDDYLAKPIIDSQLVREKIDRFLSH
jgi:CheY-like chemotaxis protein